MKTRFFLFLTTLLILLPAVVWAQAGGRYALVIGNNNYNTIERLSNPVNDATDVAAKLRSLGYQVELHTNLNSAGMGRAIDGYMQRLSQNKNNEGFFWFAGHGVEIDGENFLLPIDVDDRDDVAVKYTSYPVNRLVESFDRVARNKINIVVLDACRNNPFRNRTGGTRNLSRGFSIIPNIPSDILVIYSTAANDIAMDGEGKRNSPFAQAFLQNMDRNEDIRIVTSGIARATLQLTNNKQRPYLGGSIVNLDFYSLNPQGAVASSSTASSAQNAAANQTPAYDPRTSPAPGMIKIKGGAFTMGSPVNEPGRHNRESPQHRVTVSDFYIARYPVSQAEYETVMGLNPSRLKVANLPVENITWFDAVDYCNKLSEREGLTPVYSTTVEGSVRTITWNRDANGYRLPTEAEWEYACRAGTTTAYNTGSSISARQANFDSERTAPAGSFAPNAWGLYDMHGNVFEWCWDFLSSYTSGEKTNPAGPSSGSNRVLRGGSWNSSAQHLRSAARSSLVPTSRGNNIGLRVARNAVKEEQGEKL